MTPNYAFPACQRAGPCITALFLVCESSSTPHAIIHRCIFFSRWLAPLLTQTLPLSSIYLVWDALFSCPTRERDMNPKIDHLLNICTSMLSRARAPLFRLVMTCHQIVIFQLREPLSDWESPGAGRLVCGERRTLLDRLRHLYALGS